MMTERQTLVATASTGKPTPPAMPRAAVGEERKKALLF
jgi:hypothetical protein